MIWVSGLPGKRILVVDDDPNVRFLFRLILESDGYEISEANNGIAALLRINDSLPDLLMTDMMMPMMDGEALINHLRGDPRTAKLKILAFTANPRVAAAQSADSVLGKLFDRSELLALAASLLRPEGSSVD
ncbi:MAG: response regulator [Candidatus Dormibacteraceae bacterium]